jgi:hypothetical protein
VQAKPPVWMTPSPPRPAALQRDTILVPDAKRIVLGVSYEQSKVLAALPGAELHGPLVVLPWRRGAEIRVGSHLLLSPSSE